MGSNTVQNCRSSAQQSSRRRCGAGVALTISLCLGAASLVNAQSLVGGRNVNIAGGKQVLSISPYEVRGDVLNRAQNEPSCAISTRNPKNILCGANDYRMIDVPGVTVTQITRDAWLGEFQSADGGDTWESTLHRGFYLDPTPHPLRLLQLRAAADPTIRSGPAGLAFFSGIAFTQDRSRSVVFVTTYADLSTREDDKQPFKFVRTTIPEIATTGRFIDKPWMFVEAAPAGQTCTVTAQVVRDGVTTSVQQTVPASIVHLVYSVFVDSTDTLAQLMYVRSDNCGTTFTKPKQLNQGTQPANGGAIAKPLNSTSQRVFATWRRVQTPTSTPSNAIVGVVSNDNGTTWSAPVVIADICPFDQGTTTVSFRTTAFPSMTADATGRAYVAWSDRGRLASGECNPEGAARVNVATSTDGVTWTRSAPVPSPTPEHQILPSIVFTAGRLALAWLDFTEDASRVFGRFVSEAQVTPIPNIRHTADVRAAMAQPGAVPAFNQPTMISEYLRGVGFANGQRVATQLQWNAVNRRWARRGTVPFNGDYIDIATLPYLPPDPATGSTAWVPNNQAVVQTALGPAPRVPLLLLAWTDNRDMRTAPDVDIPPGHDPDNPASPQPEPVPFVVPTGLNLPPGSIADPTQVRIECTTSGDVYKTGTTNQNAYTARATIGVAAGTPANNKVLGNLQRSFVVFVRNDTLAGKTFRLVASQPAGGFASFDQFDSARTTTDIFVPARSSVSRTVFVTQNPGAPVALDPNAVIRVDVIETQGITPIQVTTIYINSDPSAPEIDSPEIDSREIFSPEIDSPEIDSPEIDSPEIDSRGFSSPEIDSPEIDSPEIDSPEIDSPEIDSQEIRALGLQTPEIDSPEIDSPEIDSPEIDSPEIDSPEIDSSAITDITFKVTNDGNTTGQYNAKALVGTAAGPGFRYQVIVRRTYSLPAVGGDCRPTTIAVSKVAVNLTDVTPPSPEIDSPEIDSPEIDSPEIDSSAIDTASFFVAPEETVEVVVRVRSKSVPTTAQLSAILQNVDLAVQQEAVNSDDVAVGITEPPVITSYLSVATQALAAGQTTTAYAFALQASGGPEPHQWSLTGGTLPPGIGLSADGQLAGAPTVAGTYTFTVRVTDADGNMASRAFALSVTTPGTPALAFVTQPSNPILGAVITPYPSVRALTANGNPAPGAPVTVQLVGTGTLVGTFTRVTGPSGVAVFDDLRLTTSAAGAALLASAPTFTDTTSVAFGTTQPDLIVESLTHSPINPTSVDSLTLTAVVKNVGNGPSGPTMVSLLVSGEAPGDEGTVFPVPALAPNATFTVQRLTPPVGAGPQTTSATVDGTNTVIESSEGNNTGADSFVATLQTAPVVDGLTAWWRAEGDGNDSIDGSHGTLIGGVEFGAGRTGGQAFSLDGVNDRIDVGPGFNLDDLTLSAWVFINPVTNQGDRVVISKDNLGGTGTRKAFVLKSSNTVSTAPANRPAFLVLIGNPPDPTSPLVDLLEGPAPLSAGWHHLAGVRDTSAGRFEFYIDGVLAASKVPTVVGVIDSMVNTVIGGVNPTFYGQFFAGRIDDAQIFDQALTAAQIAALAAPAAVEGIVHSPVSAPGATTEPLMVREAQGLGGDANRDLFVLHGNGQVSMMSGNGTGAFTQGPLLTIPGLSGTVRDMRVGHVSNSGHPFVNVVTDGATNNVALLQTDGNLGWLPPLVVSMPAGLSAVVNGQFSTALDPSTDLAFVSPTTNQLFILLNSGATTSLALPGQAPIALKAGHLNKQADGFLDLVVLNRGSRDVTVLLGNGAGGFVVSGTFPLGAAGQRTPSNSADALELADFNSDGILDVAVASDAPIGEEGQSVIVLLGNGLGGLGAGTAHNVDAGPLTLTTADLDNDGNVDIATANPADNSISVLHGDGAGNFGPAEALTAGNTPRGIIAVDVTNDGKPELVVANQFQRASVTVDEVSTIIDPVAGVGPFAVTTTGDAGPGSLRQAITNANARPGLDSITFNLPGSGPHVIGLASNLPVVTDPITIDGTTQPGYTGTPRVELNGAAIGGQAFGLEISAGGSIVRGLAFTNFAPGDSGHGLLVNAGAGGTSVQANYIGLSAAGTPPGDATLAFGLVAMAPTFIGGGGAAARNVISGASTSAITLGNGGSGVLGNYIGTTADGSAAALSNATGTGIDLTQAGPYFVDLNVVSGLLTGVFVNQPVTGLTLTRNLVGTNAAGNTALQGPANSTGIAVNAPNTAIGGTTAANGNTIAGYATGISVGQFGTALIRNNRIGMSADGLAVLPGMFQGIVLDSSNNTVTGNAIAGTGGRGVLLRLNAPAGNAVTDNVIRDNANTGIGVAATGSSGNTLVPNTFANNGLAIDLNFPDGPTANDPGDADTGPNDIQNFPGLTGATPNGATTLVTGVLHSTPNGAFTIHIFQNAFCPANGRGEGTVIGTVAMSTGADGRGSFSVALPGVVSGSFLAATATNLAGSTSEVSDCVNVTAPPGVGTTLAFVAQPSSSAVNAVISPAVAVAATDDGDGVAGVQVTLQLQGATGLSGTLVRTTNANGVAVFDDLSLGLPVANVTLLATADSFDSATSTTFGALLPDLVVQSLTHTPANPAIGAPITFNAVVRNAGTATAVASTARWSLTPGPNAALEQIPALAPGETIAIQRQLTLAVAQDYVSNLAVDFTSLVLESNETNNTATENLTVSTGGGGGTAFVVTNTGDSGTGSLRQAILDANGAAGADSISFSLEGPGPFTIAPQSPLPAITGPVTIDGRTQPGFTTTPVVILDGALAGAGAHGLQIASGATTVRGLVVHRFGGSGIVLTAGGGNVVEGNYIGTDVTGQTDLGNGANGIHVIDSPNNVIGGDTSGARNLIAGNQGEGVRIDGALATGNTVKGNAIGMSAGAQPLGNSASGVYIRRSSSNIVQDNQIRFNHGFAGVAICGNAAFCGGGDIGTQGDTASGNRLERNIIAGNVGHGVTIDGAPQTAIGVVGANPGNDISSNAIGVFVFSVGATGTQILNNTITGNSVAGVVVSGASNTGTQIQTNTFSNNQSLAIDLNGDGVTANDADDTDTGPNNLQNFPVITAATATSVTFTLQSTPNTNFPIQLFSNAACDASGNGEGQVLLDTLGVTTDGSGFVSFTRGSLTLAIGSFVTATAHGPDGTSEFSACVNVTAPSGVGTTLAFVTQPTSSAINAVISPAVTVAATDDGDGVAGIQVTLQLQGATGLSGTLVRTTNANGVAVFDDLSLGLPASNVTLLATATGFDSATSASFGTLLPDLVVQSLTHTPATPATGSPITFNAVVRNAGTATAVASTARWSVTPGPNAALEPIPALAPGETFAIQRQVTLNVAQAYVSNLEVDFTSLALESNETNNTATENLTVTTGGGGGTAFVVTDTGDSGTGSLRQAILDANDTAGADSITFNIPGTGPFTITPLSPLPTLTGPVNINATTQPGYAGSPIVGLSGASAGANAVALHLTAGTSVVRGLQISAFDGHGILIEGPGGNVIAGNYLGVTFAGDAPIDDGNGDAIRIQESSNNIIGGTTGTTPGGPCTGDCNVIVGRHASAAVSAIGINGGAGSGSTTATGNQVLGNHIGVNAAGTVGMASLSAFGVLAFHAQGTIVGDGTPAGRNVISGNNTGLILTSNSVSVRGNYIGTTADGSAAILNPFSTINNANSGLLLNGDNGVVEGNLVSGNGNGLAIAIQLANANSNTIRGNIIGLNAQGTAAVPNGFGVYLGAFSSNNTVGGSTAAMRNVISGNLQHGVWLLTESGSNNTIAGNYIGTDITGALSRGNQGNGVLVEDAPDNTIGGAQPGQRNVISGNSGAGVVIQGATATGNVVRNNYIGTDSSGGSNIGNGIGVRIVDAHSNEIAGAPDFNLIKGNLSHGVTVEGATALGNQIANNQIFDNGGLGIDLGGDGVTANDATDADTGPNNLQNFPVLTAVSPTSVTVTLQSTPNANFAVGLFSNAACDPSGNGEGQTRFDTLGLTTDGTGFGSVVRGNLLLGLGTFVTAAVTGPNGTSEFSACAPVTGGEGTTVTVVATDASANEVGPDPGSFTFTRTGSTAAPLLVNYSISGTASSGSDYTPALTGTFTIPAGVASDTLTLTPVLDAVIEGNEDIQLTLTPGAGYVVGSPNAGTVIIADAPVITIQATDASASEAGPDTGTFTITSSSQAAATVNFTVTGTATSGTDYTSLGVSVLKPAGVTTVTLTVAPLQDGVPEGAENVTVTLAAGSYGIGTPNNATVTIADSANIAVGNTADSGPGSLRAAIDAANANADVSSITFNIPGAGPHVINVPSLLPSLTQPVVLDGTTQPGYAGTPLIRLSAVAGGGGRGIQIDGSGVTLRGLSITGFSGSGIELRAAGGGSVVEASYIGLTPAGVAAGNGNNGLTIIDSPNNRVGGLTPGSGNVISGNGSNGIDITGGSGNVVQGNFLGTNAAGTLAIPNASGVVIRSAGNTVGGTAAGARNILSGNNISGVQLASPAATGNVIQGNYIGTDVTGTLDLGNLQSGVNVVSSNNIIGGNTAAARNVISGNNLRGVFLAGSGGANGNQVRGNFIGTDISGTAAVPNGIGVSVGFDSGFTASNNIIGGAGPGEGNLIAQNASSGVFVVTGSVGNSIRGNAIHQNTALGIDLEATGVTPNDLGDADTGPNNRQNFPTVTSATAGLPTIGGTLNSLANTQFALDFYGSSSCDASGFGEGQRYLGAFNVVTDGSGNAAFSANITGVPLGGEFVTATATDPSGNTSEFSACFQLVVAPTTVQVFTSVLGSESGPTPGSFLVVRSGVGPFPLPLDVNLSLTGGTATPEADFTPALPTITVTIPANLSAVSVPITIVDDANIEGPETVVATVLAGAGYLPSGEPATLVITDNDGVGQIGGTITTGGDTPISFALVDVFDTSGVLVDVVVTQIGGTYLTNMLPPGNYFVRTQTFQGYLDELYNNIVCSPDCTITTGTSVAVAANQVTNDIDFDLDLGGTIGGTVTSTSSGLGVPFATIELRRQGVTDPNFFYYTQTDDLGVYEVIGLAPGNYFARTLTGLVDEVWNNTTCVGCDPTLGTAIPVTLASVTNNINFSLADGARITGTVLDATTATPLADAPVQIFTANGQLVGTALTDSTGAYSSTGLTPGTYFARTKSDYVGPGPFGAVSGIPGYPDELFSEIACAAGCVVTSGTQIVVGAAGTVTSGIGFTLTPPTGTATITTTDATAKEGTSDVATFSVTVSGPTTGDRFAGVIITGGTATHEVDYTVTSPDMWFQSAGFFIVRIPAGQSASTLTLVAAADGIAEGSETVEFSAGVSIANATISD